MAKRSVSRKSPKNNPPPRESYRGKVEYYRIVASSFYRNQYFHRIWQYNRWAELTRQLLAPVDDKTSDYWFTVGFKEHRRRITANVGAQNGRARRLGIEGVLRAGDVVRIFDLQRGLCWYCDEPLDSTFEIEHVIPLSKGGTNHIENICLACKSCNRSKHARTPTQWRGAVFQWL
jgi:hypothetical protein